MERQTVSRKRLEDQISNSKSAISSLPSTQMHFYDQQRQQHKQKHDQEPKEHTCYERPMTLNAWTQTTAEDFSYFPSAKMSTDTEKEIMEKIEKLENMLRAQAEIINKIQQSQSRRNSVHEESADMETTPDSVSTAVHHQLNKSNHHLQQPQGRDQQNNTNESVKYRIIAEQNGDIINENLIEPIEIQIAEEDGALNLNSSVESGRLEICLTDECADVKNMSYHQESSLTSNETSYSVAKKRKLSATSTPMRSLEKTNSVSNYYLNERGVLAPVKHTSSLANLFIPEDKPIVKMLTNNNDLNQIPVTQSSDNTGYMINLGPNDTKVPATIFNNICWTSPSIATRKLLMAIFDRYTLATHSMTGKPSPAFKDHDKPLKKMLNPTAIADIIYIVTKKCGASEKEVRNAITTKCADENKMLKLQQQKKLNKENSR